MTSSRHNKRWQVFATVAVFAILLGAAAFAQQPPADDGFVPVTQAELLDEQLPAAPLVLGAYAVAWLAVFGYLWFLWRRLTRVEKELADVSRRIQREARR
jgi:CcmD family protein